MPEMMNQNLLQEETGGKVCYDIFLSENIHMNCTCLSTLSFFFCLNFLSTGSLYY